MEGTSYDVELGSDAPSKIKVHVTPYQIKKNEYVYAKKKTIQKTLFEDSPTAFIDYDYYDHYIFPESSSRYLNNQDIARMSSWEIKLGKNEIYARYGRRFTNPDIQSYFDSQMWYVGSIEASDFDALGTSFFNTYEKKNIRFLAKYE